MFEENLKDYRFTDIKQRMAELDSQLSQVEAEPQASDDIFAMMPTVQHKSDGDFMDQVESRSQELHNKDEEKKDLEKELEMLQLEKQRRLVKHHEIVEKK